MKVVDYSKHCFIPLSDSNDDLSCVSNMYLKIDDDFLEKIEEYIKFVKTLPDSVERISFELPSNYVVIRDEEDTFVSEFVDEASEYGVYDLIFVDSVDIDALEEIEQRLNSIYLTFYRYGFRTGRFYIEGQTDTMGLITFSSRAALYLEDFEEKVN